MPPQKHISEMPQTGVAPIAPLAPALFSMPIVVQGDKGKVDEGVLRDLAMQLDAYATADIQKRKMKLAIRELSMRAMSDWGGLNRNALRALLYRYAIEDAIKQVIETREEELKKYVKNPKEALRKIVVDSFPKMRAADIDRLALEYASDRTKLSDLMQSDKDGPTKAAGELATVAKELRETIRKNLAMIAEEIERFAENKFFFDDALGKTMAKIANDIREGGIMGVEEKGLIFKTRLVPKELLKDPRIVQAVEDSMGTVDANLEKASEVKELIRKIKELRRGIKKGGKGKDTDELEKRVDELEQTMLNVIRILYAKKSSGGSSASSS